MTLNYTPENFADAKCNINIFAAIHMAKKYGHIDYDVKNCVLKSYCQFNYDKHISFPNVLNLDEEISYYRTDFRFTLLNFKSNLYFYSLIFDDCPHEEKFYLYEKSEDFVKDAFAAESKGYKVSIQEFFDVSQAKEPVYLDFEKLSKSEAPEILEWLYKQTGFRKEDHKISIDKVLRH